MKRLFIYPLVALLISGCAIGPGPKMQANANLSSGESIIIHYNEDSYNTGNMSFTLPDGEAFRGEYIGDNKGYQERMHYISATLDSNQNRSKCAITLTYKGGERMFGDGNCKISDGRDIRMHIVL